MYFSCGRRPSSPASRTMKCVLCSSSSSIARTHWTTSAPSIARQHARDEVHALEHHRPALLERALDRGAHADEHVPRLLEEAGDDRILRLLRLAQAGGRLEARVVDRRHELLREERAHRLPDEVGRRDARDPEPVRASVATVDLPVPVAPPTRTITGRSSSWSSRKRRSRRTASEPSSSPSTSIASSSTRSSSTLCSPRSIRSWSMRFASSYARPSGTPTATSARAIRPFEYGWSGVPSGSGSEWRGWLIRVLRPERSARIASSSSPATTTSFSAKHDLARLAPRAASATTSIAAALISTR